MRRAVFSLSGRCIPALAFAALAAAQTPSPAPAAGSQEPADASCAVCHGAEGLQVGRSVHARAGVTCTACHGGVAGALDETAHEGEFQALTDPRAAVESCGACHSDQERMRVYGLRTDQLPLYWTSSHGQKLLEDGDPNVATCVSCHSAHEVLQPSDPRSPTHPLHAPETCGACHGDAERMADYELDPTVTALYRDSVHGVALLEQGNLASPSCPDCHGAHGATPPRVAEVDQVCGHCHTVVREYFDRSPHHGVARAGTMEECISCHGSHGVAVPSRAMFEGTEEGHCGSCHGPDDAAAMSVARSLHDGLAGLDELIGSAEEDLVEAAARGIFIDRERGYLDEARGLRVRAAPLSHALSAAELADLENRCQAMIQQTLESLELKTRAVRDRKIFTGVFMAISLVLAGALLRYRLGIARGWIGLRPRPRPAPGSPGSPPGSSPGSSTGGA